MNDRAKYLMTEAGSPDKIEAIKGMSCKEYLAHIETKIENEVRKRAAQSNI